MIFSLEKTNFLPNISIIFSFKN